jgi:hypothetical protein
MGGVTRAIVQPVARAVGVAKETPAGRAVQQVVEQSKPAEKPTPAKPTQEQEQAGARMRGARRRGRALLSDARLMGEMGVETLGGGSNL